MCVNLFFLLQARHLRCFRFQWGKVYFMVAVSGTCCLSFATVLSTALDNAPSDIFFKILIFNHVKSNF